MIADCHMHMLFDGVDWKAALARGIDEGFVRRTLQTYKALGYGYLRDGGDRFSVSKYARVLAPEYGIRYRTPLAPLCKEGHYGSFIGLTWEDLPHYAALVRRQKAEGADFIKIMISGIMDFSAFGVLTEPGLSPAEIRELTHIAKEEGMSVMAHCNGAETAIAAAEAGVDSIEHGAYLNSEALWAMAEARVIWVPTISTVGNLIGKGRHPDTALIPILEHFLENISSYQGLLAPGSDAGAWAVTHGCETECPLLARAGITDGRLEEGIRAVMEKF